MAQMVSEEDEEKEVMQDLRATKASLESRAYLGTKASPVWAKRDPEALWD